MIRILLMLGPIGGKIKNPKGKQSAQPTLSIFILIGSYIKKQLIQFDLAVMSQTSIQFKDQGYTSPDFLTNLFKKPLYSSYNITALESSTSNSIKDSVTHSYTSKENTEPSLLLPQKNNNSPLRFKNTPALPKFYRSHSLVDDDKISNRKFKIFFKTVMQGYMSEDEMNQIWENLEGVMRDPYAFDSFLNELKIKRQRELQQQEKNKAEKLAKCIIQRKYSKSVHRQRDNYHRISFPSQQKLKQKDSSSQQVKPSLRQVLKAEVDFTKRILIQGEKFIRKR